MDFLYKKSDGTVEDLGGNVGRIIHPTTGAVVFLGEKRPAELGDYLVIRATEITEEITSGKKRGERIVQVHKDNQKITITYPAVDQSDAEKSKLTIYKDSRTS